MQIEKYPHSRLYKASRNTLTRAEVCNEQNKEASYHCCQLAENTAVEFKRGQMKFFIGLRHLQTNICLIFQCTVELSTSVNKAEGLMQSYRVIIIRWVHKC